MKKLYFFGAGVLIFVIGALVSSQVKATEEAGIPFQMISTLITALLTFAAFMKASPIGILKKSLFAILSSAFLVILWGIPSHFGHDPTCLLFRGTFDVACWTNDFQPLVRMFSTLGQPDWLGAYLAVLLPVIAGLFIISVKNINNAAKSIVTKYLMPATYFVFFIFCYASILFTQARSTVLSVWVVMPIFFLLYFWFFGKTKTSSKFSIDLKVLVILIATVAITTFVAGQPFGQLTKFTLSGLKSAPPTQTSQLPKTQATPAPAANPVTGEVGGTSSWKIRGYVWKGAIDIWKNNLVFGTGLETYAFAYYMYRPAGHNLTSEWKYLYNKAHNEYLNYLATTGTFGIVTYLSMIGLFLFLTTRYLFDKRQKLSQNDLLIFSLAAGYGTILITNFFGFSVVIINIFFYLIPAFVFILNGSIDYNKGYVFGENKKEILILGNLQKVFVVGVAVVALYSIYTLVNFWNADRYYYFGSNYDRAGDYQKAYPFLQKAIAARPSEPTFRDEYSYNTAVLATQLVAQTQQAKDKTQSDQNLAIAKQLIQTSLDTSNKVVEEHPNDITFWKTRVRLLYTLSQVDPQYLTQTLAAIKKASELGPTDADISYNLGILYGQTGDIKNAVATLQNTIKLKPDYDRAFYALAVFYHAQAVDASGKVIDQAMNQKAIDEMQLMEKIFGKDQQAEDAIKAWTTPTP